MPESTSPADAARPCPYAPCAATRPAPCPSPPRRPRLKGATPATYDSEPAATWQAYETDHHDLRFTGDFRRELDNITFPGERAAAEKTVQTYAVYQRDDRKIRALPAAGKEQEAVEFWTGWEPDTSNAHFGAWMSALDKVADINRAHFTSSVEEGRSEVDGLLPWACGLLCAAMVLAALGLRPRLAEFRFNLPGGREERRDRPHSPADDHEPLRVRQPRLLQIQPPL
ncbi:hypothetical protein AB0958_07025 [Streptomyces sp. NPDC006655]|uniref:hypothetical protein n=1 Tax=Streptomyces sp. NPDC006655 TaxID=3156898 RepID=UPI0034557F71